MRLLKGGQLPAWDSYRRVLAIGLPLTASMASISIIHFVDRAFLGRHSLQAVAAAGPAGLYVMLAMSFFLGVATYLNVFVAQYVGAGQARKVGGVLWAGIYLAALAQACLLPLAWLAEPLFAWAGHPVQLLAMEAEYFRILCLGGGLFILQPALSAFFAGRGQTRPIMLVNLAGVLFFIPLDYALINGWGPLPELGLKGAGLALVANWGFNAGLFLLLVFQGRNRREYGLDQGWRLDGRLWASLWRFGLASGIQFSVEVCAVAYFVSMVARLGSAELAVTSVIFAIDNLAGMPMAGIMVAVSTLVGQAMGSGSPQEARPQVRAALHIALGYLSMVALLFWQAPGWVLAGFQPQRATAAELDFFWSQGAGLLGLVAVFRVVSALGFTFSGALRGAGDIRFITLAMAGAALVLLGLPLGLGLSWLGLWGCWSLFGLYVIALSLIFTLRYLKGSWQRLSLL